jgi:hypothetical protein
VIVHELKTYRKVKTELTFNEQDQIILRGSKIVLPESLRLKAKGLVKTKQLLREKVLYPGIDKLAKNTIDTCIFCQANRPNGPPEPLRMTTLPPQPWHTVNIDFCGPFPGGAYLLVVIDAYSRFPEVEIVSSTSAQSTILKLKRIFTTHFTSFQKNMVLNTNQAHLYGHKEMEKLENFMKPLTKAIRSAHHDNKDWKGEIFKFLLNYRATPHATTGKCPAELLYNRTVGTKLPQCTTENTMPVHQEVKERDTRLKKKMKEYADNKTKAKSSNIKEGDIVLVRQPKLNKMSQNTIQHHFK